MENKLISIIIPLYNKEKAIARAIESIICQTYTDWECIIINDGSTDGSVDVVRTFLSNEKIRLIHQENGGVSKARNKGLDEAKGEWVIFLDADDALLENCLSSLCDKIVSFPNIDIVCGNFYNGDNRLVLKTFEGVITNNYKAHFLEVILLRAGACIIRREFHLKYLYNEKYCRFEDMELILRMYNDARIYRISQPIMRYFDDYSTLRKKCPNFESDFTSNMDFCSVPFWGKCTMGILLYLAYFMYIERKICLIKKYHIFHIYVLFALVNKKITRVNHSNLNV